MPPYPVGVKAIARAPFACTRRDSVSHGGCIPARAKSYPLERSKDTGAGAHPTHQHKQQ